MGEKVVNAGYSVYFECVSSPPAQRRGMWWSRTGDDTESPPIACGHEFYTLLPQRMSDLAEDARSASSAGDWISTAMVSAEQDWINAQPTEARDAIWRAAKLWS